MSQKPSRKIIIAGGTGTIGTPIITALIAAGHTVGVISRPESTSPVPAGAIFRKGSYNDTDFLVSVLGDQDVLICVLSADAIASQTQLFAAAAKAGVRYILPTEFGSDPTAKVLDEVPYMHEKPAYRKLIEQLGVSSWIGVVNNPWFDSFVQAGFWGIDFKARKATVFDDGEARANFTTVNDVGKSVAGLLSLPDPELAKFKNRFVYFSSFSISQMDVVRAAMEVTKTTAADWAIERVDSVERVRAIREAAKEGDPSSTPLFLMPTMFREGYGGDYQHKVVDYKRLGVETENLNDVIERLVKDAEA